MLSLIQILEFELSPACNLGRQHTKCPNRNPARWQTLNTTLTLDADTIVRTAVRAYREFGFTGLVGWIYYNEPLLEMDRMFDCMRRIRAEAPQARFILWTNGTLLPDDCSRFVEFEQIVVSMYQDLPDQADYADKLRRLQDACPWTCFRPTSADALDDRLCAFAPLREDAPCLRPFVEFTVDAHGNVHLCCYDWRGEASPGNILISGLDRVLDRHAEMLAAIAGQRMTEFAPKACRACGHRWAAHQVHDVRIVARADKQRKQWEVDNGQ